MSHTPARSGSHLARLRVTGGDLAPYPEDHLAQVRHGEVRATLDLLDVLADAVQYAERYDTTIDTGTVRALLTDFGAHLEHPGPERARVAEPPLAPTQGAPVVVSYATINDGLVLRWYANDSTPGRELASASRNGWSVAGISDDEALVRAVVAASKYLRDVVYRGPFGREDRDAYAAARRMATHRHPRLFDDELLPLGADS